MYIHVSNWLSKHDNVRWLLIFDNYDDPDQYELHKYYPFVAHGSVIVITRQPDRLNGHRIKVRSISSRDESIRILTTRCERDNVESGRKTLTTAKQALLTSGRSYLTAYRPGCSTTGPETGRAFLSPGHGWDLSESVFCRLYPISPAV
jgi:hypothetical protein